MPQPVADMLHWLAAWPVASFFRSSTAAYATLNALHIVSIGLIVGSIAALDLRLLGVFRAAPLSALGRPLVRVAATGVATAVVSGFLLFSVRPLAYAENPAFLLKVALVAIGVANALAVRASRSWRDACRSGEITPRLRLGAAVSLVTWVLAVFAGRWIGFLQ
jgi:hypothetical protein